MHCRILALGRLGLDRSIHTQNHTGSQVLTPPGTHLEVDGMAPEDLQTKGVNSTWTLTIQQHDQLLPNRAPNGGAQQLHLPNPRAKPVKNTPGHEQPA